jgi:hypothetical protein
VKETMFVYRMTRQASTLGALLSNIMNERTSWTALLSCIVKRSGRVFIGSATSEHSLLSSCGVARN